MPGKAAAIANHRISTIKTARKALTVNTSATIISANANANADASDASDADTTTTTATMTTITTPHPFARLQNPSRWEIARMVLGILSGLVPLRLFVLISSLVVGGSVTVAFHHLGLRSLCIYNTRILCRWLLFVSGHFYIPVAMAGTNNTHNDKHNDNDKHIFRSGKCPTIIVSNHVSNMEILHLLTLPFKDASGNPVMPVFVTKESIFGLPFVGIIARDVLGSIGVARKKESNSVGVEGEGEGSCTEQIVSRVRDHHKRSSNGNGNGSSNGPIVIFPEGTTTNGTCLLAFKRGAFVPMEAVQPVLYSFGSDAYDPERSAFLPTYESIWGPAYLWRLLCQPVHQFSCEFLDPIAPPAVAVADAVADADADASTTEIEIDPASLFAERVRSKMALEGNLPLLSDDYNYKHKLKYHNGLRKAFVSHPRGPKHAMCFAPMQKVFSDNETTGTTATATDASASASASTSSGFDVVEGTSFVFVDKHDGSNNNTADLDRDSKDKKDT